MYKPSLADLKSIAAQYPVLPVTREILADIKTPIAMLKTLKSISSCCFLLESVEGGEKWSRYSFLGFDPLTEITCKNNIVTINNGVSVQFNTDNPQQYLRQILKEYQSPRLEGLPPFTGGLVGYFAYDYAKYAEPTLVLDNPDDTNFNDFDLMLFDKVIAFDHLKQKIIITVNIKTDNLEVNYNKAKLDLDYLVELISKPTCYTEQSGKLTSEFVSEFSEEEYAEAVAKAKYHINEGDIFQVVLSNRRMAEFHGSLLNTYRVLRTTNPSPYMFYFSGHDVELTGASPETLVKLQAGKLMTYPIAGTKPRGKTVEEDQALATELLNDPKELAEHDMLVDLGRNDLGRISEFGSVKLESYHEIERFSHVMHLTSTVSSQIRSDKDALDAIEAMLPAGTLSGAPKIRAMQIINELERSARGIYGGAVGYIDFTGNMDVCIAIRMAVKKADKVYVRAGGGIVKDSNPQSEYQETVNKAQAMIEAIIRSQEVDC